MFHVLLSCTSVYLWTWGFQKENIAKKKLQDQQRLSKKLRFFIQNMLFWRAVLVYKKIIYFTGSIFPVVTGNILEEYVDLITTQEKADHFASYGIIEGSKQGITVITCFYHNFWMQDIHRAI